MAGVDSQQRGEGTRPSLRLGRRAFLRLAAAAAPLAAMTAAESSASLRTEVARKQTDVGGSGRQAVAPNATELSAPRPYLSATPLDQLAGSQPLVFNNPVITANCPDPHILKVDGGFYLVSTSHNLPAFPIRESTDLVNWRDTGLHVFTRANQPRWAKDHFWAPELHRVSDYYVAYYTARSRITDRLCIGAAASRAPFGPYRDLGHPLVSAATSVLDATFFRDEDGRQYLYWKADAGPGDASGPIHARELAPNGLSLSGPQWDVAHTDQPWELGLIEGPTVLKRDGVYYLFYSGAAFDSTTYAIGVARSSSPIEGFEKRGDPILQSSERWRGPGHNSIVSHEGFDYIAYHAWEGVQFRNLRQSLIEPLLWGEDGWPRVHEPGTPGE